MNERTSQRTTRSDCRRFAKQDYIYLFKMGKPSKNNGRGNRFSRPLQFCKSSVVPRDIRFNSFYQRVHERRTIRCHRNSNQSSLFHGRRVEEGRFVRFTHSLQCVRFFKNAIQWCVHQLPIHQVYVYGHQHNQFETSGSYPTVYSRFTG